MLNHPVNRITGRANDLWLQVREQHNLGPVFFHIHWRGATWIYEHHNKDKGQEEASAGVAIWEPKIQVASILLNYDEAMANPDKYITDVVPHEIAHLVRMIKYRDAEHSEGWRALCIDLGGTGMTLYDEAEHESLRAAYEKPSRKG